MRNFGDFEFQNEGVTFILKSSFGYKEKIYAGDTLVSEMRSLRGGKHKFEYHGSFYEVKVIPGFFGEVDFEIIKNNFVVRKKESQFEQLPAAFLMIGIACIMLSIKLFWKEGISLLRTAALVFFGVGIFLLITGAVIAMKRL